MRYVQPMKHPNPIWLLILSVLSWHSFAATGQFDYPALRSLCEKSRPLLKQAHSACSIRKETPLTASELPADDIKKYAVNIAKQMLTYNTLQMKWSNETLKPLFATAAWNKYLALFKKPLFKPTPIHALIATRPKHSLVAIRKQGVANGHRYWLIPVPLFVLKIPLNPLAMMRGEAGPVLLTLHLSKEAPLDELSSLKIIDFMLTIHPKQWITP